MPIVVDPKNGEMDEAGHIVSKPCVTYRPLYRNWCLPSKDWQVVYLESLRYKWRYRQHNVRVMASIARTVDRIVERVFGA
jgi:hypothetical protein